MMNETEETVKRAILVGVHLKQEPLKLAEASMDELANLARTLSIEVNEIVLQSKDRYDSKTFVGTGKLEELKAILDETGVKTVIFDHELSPNQGKNIEKVLEVMVLDRTQLILEIFLDHAKTPEAKAQVEVAQLKYMLPRLVGMWAHLDREKGGIGASRGAGEKQVNIDRTLVRQRISKLERVLEQSQLDRTIQAKQRENCYQVAFTGYTNAGKTTLMNQISKLDREGEDKLFATLDSRTRKLEGFTNPELLLSDTVGFIQNLPHGLVASFRSTLSVVCNADLLLHVVDATSPVLPQHLETTLKVLKEIGADEVPQLLVFNKIDLLSDPAHLVWLNSKYPGCLTVSSFDEVGLKVLVEKIQDFFTKNYISQEVLIPYDRQKWVNRYHELTEVKSQEFEEEGVRISYRATQTNQKILDAMRQKELE